MWGAVIGDIAGSRFEDTQAYLPMTPELLDEASKRFARYALVEEQENDNA